MMKSIINTQCYLKVLEKPSILFRPIIVGLLFFLISVTLYPQNIGINSTGNSPNASAGLDIDFTDKGVLIPRVSYCQRVTPGCANGLLDGSGNLVAAARGLLVYQSGTGGEGEGFYYNTSTTVTPSWVKVGSSTRVRASRGSLQSIPHNSYTKVQYSTEEFDNLNEFDNSTNYRFTATVSGYYLITARVQFNSYAWPANGAIELSIYVNGVQNTILDRKIIEAANTNYYTTEGSSIISMSSSDYLEIYIHHTQGGPINILNQAKANYVTIHKLD